MIIRILLYPQSEQYPSFLAVEVHVVVEILRDRDHNDACILVWCKTKLDSRDERMVQPVNSAGSTEPLGFALVGCRRLLGVNFRATNADQMIRKETSQPPYGVKVNLEK